MHLAMSKVPISDISNRGVIATSYTIGYKSEPPTNTIMIQHLPQHVTENDIKQDVIHCGLTPNDIRLIRNKKTGELRGFAFVEFSTIAEATAWIDTKQGVLKLKDQYHSIMHYAIHKSRCHTTSNWFCIKCWSQNFKRKDNCLVCKASRMESEKGGAGIDETCTYITKTIMLRNLDVLTMEDSVIQVLNTVIPDIRNKICSVSIGRDPLISTSRGICYLETNSVSDAFAVHGALSGLTSPLTIDGKTVNISYCKYSIRATKSPYEQDNNTTSPNAAQVTTYSASDVDKLAEYSATKYAKTVEEFNHYFEQYKNYFTQQINEGPSINIYQTNQVEAANAPVAITQSAIQQMQPNKIFYNTTHLVIPNGTDGKRYPVPDISKYIFDRVSGYHYDSSTGLYYIQNSGYYWNSMIRKHLLYDQKKLTYVLAPIAYDTYSGTQQVAVCGIKPEVEKQDNFEVARRIVKDMERWTKSLEQKKDSLSTRDNTDIALASSYSGASSADIGYSVLKNELDNFSLHISPLGFPALHSSQAVPLVAGYIHKRESAKKNEVQFIKNNLLDYTKLICRLCKWQLRSAYALTRHAKFSESHKQNFKTHRALKKQKYSLSWF